MNLHAKKKQKIFSMQSFGRGASLVSVELLPVCVVAGIATRFLMIKSTTAYTENCKHTSRGHPQEKKVEYAKKS